ncbi:multidrug effflux MFS transporter [Pseudoflavitalea sp. G-6-1-2]|uniref:multidrug effflux MFS transporter n=1 Tax=Pseudoflavitalea sp. G-6-1-2 TaxID=2728841 RepID=UPI00146DE392|nr:multidrug effflux MFS transporter [Pseudoflavitalea sp. G-6-1-2]NML19886.1 multidrug effflux MFS transporter [Pseudoflavitalea sp. G-6-1-2]
MTGKRYYLTILILGSLTAIVPFSIDMYLPGFKAIAGELKTTVPDVALSLSSFFIGVSVSQLFYGPLLDRFGRKRPLYLGLTIYILSSIACVIVGSLDALIALRFVQAIGACAAQVAAFAMVRDIFPVEDNAKVFSSLMLVLSASPLIAPTAGGYLIAHFGWHAVFFVLAAISLIVMIAVWRGLPESSKPDPNYSLKPASILGNYWEVIRNRQFFTYALSGAIGFSGLFIYISCSPSVFLEFYKVSEQTYGWIFALLASGIILATQTNRLVLKYFSSAQIIQGALITQTIFGVLLVLATYNNWIGLPGMLVLLFLFLACAGFVLPNSSAMCMQPFTRNAGSASALMGALQMGIGSLGSFLVSRFHGNSPLPMAAGMAIFAAVALTLLLTTSKKIQPVTA